MTQCARASSAITPASVTRHEDEGQRRWPVRGSRDVLVAVDAEEHDHEEEEDDDRAGVDDDLDRRQEVGLLLDERTATPNSVMTSMSARAPGSSR